MTPRRCLILLVFVAGCSTHPLVDFCDYFKPGHLYPDKVTPYGGIAVQSGTIPGTAPSAPFAPVVPPPAPVIPSGPPISVPTFPTAPGSGMPPPPSFPP